MDRTLVCYELGPAYCAFVRLYPSNYGGVTSTKNLAHWAQAVATQRWQQFVEDWDYPDNWSAPEYEPSNIKTVPISLIVSENDDICTSKRAAWLAEQLQTLQSHVFIEGWNHYQYSYSSQPEYLDILFNAVLAEPGTKFTGIQTV